MSGTYSNALPGVPISLNAIRGAAEQIAAMPRVVPDLTIARVARDVWEALRAGLPVSAEAPMTARRVHVDEHLPGGTWHEGTPR